MHPPWRRLAVVIMAELLVGGVIVSVFHGALFPAIGSFVVVALLSVVRWRGAGTDG